MNNTLQVGQLTMSSLEIAELTGQQHKNVLAGADNMLKNLGIDSAEYSAQYKDSTGRTLRCYHFNQDLTMTLVSKFSDPLRYRVMVRWRELEEEKSGPRGAEMACYDAIRELATTVNTGFAGVNHKLEVVQGTLDNHGERLSTLESTSKPRVDFAIRARETFDIVSERFYFGNCPIYPHLPATQYDHWGAKHINWLSNGWKISEKANQEFKHPVQEQILRQKHKPLFDAFQQRAAPIHEEIKKVKKRPKRQKNHPQRTLWPESDAQA